MNNKKVLFIGAGASYGARSEHKVQPPLGQELGSWLRNTLSELKGKIGLLQWEPEIEEALSVLEKRTHNDFECLMSKLTAEERSQINMSLLITMSNISDKRSSHDLEGADFGFCEITDGYDNLIDKLNIKNGMWSIVSLNYDILIEQALARHNISVIYPHFPSSYGQDQSVLSGVKIYKPHGSINFFVQPDPGRYGYNGSVHNNHSHMSIETHIDKNGKFNPTYPIVMACPNGVDNVLCTVLASSPRRPVIANYTYGKISDTNQETLERVRQEALSAFREAMEIVAVGVRPIMDKKDDEFVSNVFSILGLKNITYVSKSKDDCDNVKYLCPNAEIFAEGLLDYLRN